MPVKQLTFEIYASDISNLMNTERALRVRDLRIRLGCTYQKVSEVLHKEWGKDATWPKVGDKLAGEALCVFAARKLGEVPYKEPWA